LKRDIVSGTLLIVGPAAGAVVMLLHPTAHGLMDPEHGTHLAFVNVMVHSLALAATPAVFMGLLGLWRRLGSGELSTAALIAYGWGCVALMGAAVASGFVAPGVIAPSSELLRYTGLWNQAFAKVYVVASSIGILLFAISIVTSRRLAPAAGAVGAFIGVAILVLFAVGHLAVDVHGFGAITFAQSAWLIVVGVLLCRPGRTRDPEFIPPELSD
jgi:hypothetical protein